MKPPAPAKPLRPGALPPAVTPRGAQSAVVPLVRGPDESGTSRRSARSPARAMTPGRVVATKYRLEHLLKSGGMGSVWVATHLGLGTPVAMKFMAARLHSGAGEDEAAALEARKRFEQEAKAAAQIRSTHVVQILDYGVEEDVPYIVMELLVGEDLGARLDRVGRLTTEGMAAIVTPIAHALQLAHDAGMVHRDLKPENVFLAKEGDVEVPKILDFGVAKAMSDADWSASASTEGVVVGTTHFMSPEQAMGNSDIDHRSDLWSLGVVIFYGLTGQKPFPSTQPLEAIVQICSAPIPSASSLEPELSARIDAFLARALSRDAEARFSTAKAMAKAFVEAVAPDRPEERASVAVSPPPASTPSVPKPARARGALVVAGATVAVGGALFLGLREAPRAATATPASSAAAAPVLPDSSSRGLEHPPPPPIARSDAGASGSPAVSARPRPSRLSPAKSAAPAPPPTSRKPDVGY